MKKYKFIDLPRQVGADYYTMAREEIIQYFSQNSDVLSIYEYGSVSSPGVSDLDIILVLKDEVKTQEEFFEFSNISKEVYHLLGDGTVMKMSQENFVNINFLENNIKVKKLFGKNLKPLMPHKTYQETLDLISVIDWLPERIIRLTRVLTTENVNTIDALTLLHSFSYTIRKVDNITYLDNKFPKSQSVLNKIKLLRNNWHSLVNPKQVLMECIQESISLGYSYLDLFEDHLKNSCNYSNSNINLDEDVSLELYDNHFIKFVSSFRKTQKKITAIEMSQHDKKYVLISDYFYPHFECLASQSGLLSSVMIKKIKPYLKLRENLLIPEYQNNLVKKITIAEDNAKFLIKNSMKNGLFRYGFHFKK